MHEVYTKAGSLAHEYSKTGKKRRKQVKENDRTKERDALTYSVFELPEQRKVPFHR